MIEALRCAREKKELSVFEIVDYMRRHRMFCVQREEQYMFVYDELSSSYRLHALSKGDNIFLDYITC